MTDTILPGSGRGAEGPERVGGAAAVRARRETTLRVPPQSLEAERAVLAAALLDSVAIAVIAQTLSADDFYKPAHRKICAAIFRMFEKNDAVDLVTLTEELNSAGDLEQVGGEVYLAEILDAAVTAANVEFHARIVREKSLLRQMIRATAEIAEEAYTAPDDVNAFIDRAEHKMFEISESGPRKGFVAVKDLLQESFEKIEALYNDKRLVTGIPTGFVDLDTMTAGLQRSDFVVVAARPSMGKTAFTLNIAEHVSVEHRLPVAFFSLEMSKEALVQRLLSSLSRVDGNRLRTGFLRESEWPRLTTAAGKLSEAELYIDDSAGITALEIRAKSRRLMVETKGRLAMIVVDYLQLIHGHGRTENRQQEISHISRSLKALAKELRIPVVALSQLKRPTDVKEGGRRPVLSDLRECVTGDTPVVLGDGRRVPVRDLVGESPEVVAVDERGRLTLATSDRVWSVGRRPVYRVGLASGRSIRATAEHRLLAGRGWTTVSALTLGDRLAVSRFLPEPRVRVVAQGAYRPMHVVAVSGGEAQRRFLDAVGGFGPRSAPAEELALALASSPASTNVDTLPREIFQAVRTRMASRGISQRAMTKLRGTSYGGSSHFRFAPSRETLAEYAKLLDDPELQDAATSDLFWDRITSIEAAGEEEVFDLTVPGPSCWLADGIVSHNSGAIEQDADVVVFIHRPEVYGVAEKEGIAEIILGKQRNGPIGMIELSFQKSVTRFENLARVRE